MFAKILVEDDFGSQNISIDIRGCKISENASILDHMKIGG